MCLVVTLVLTPFLSLLKTDKGIGITSGIPNIKGNPTVLSSTPFVTELLKSACISCQMSMSNPIFLVDIEPSGFTTGTLLFNVFCPTNLPPESAILSTL